jgi:hypothetical protein
VALWFTLLLFINKKILVSGLCMVGHAGSSRTQQQTDKIAYALALGRLLETKAAEKTINIFKSEAV